MTWMVTRSWQIYAQWQKKSDLTIMQQYFPSYGWDQVGESVQGFFSIIWPNEGECQSYRFLDLGTYPPSVGHATPICIGLCLICYFLFDLLITFV
jgi:hypothetical protein